MSQDQKRIKELEKMISFYQDDVVPKMRKEINELKADLREWVRTFDMLNDRENRHKYIEWWRERYNESDLAYPDGDQIYKDFWSVMDDLRSACECDNALTWVMQRELLKQKWGFNDE